MIVRKAELGDLDSVIEMGSGAKEFETGKEVVVFWPRYILERLVNSSEDIFLVAENNKEIIGFIIVNNNDVFRKAIVENVYVNPEFRRKGFGRKLIERAIEELKKLKCEYICILAEKNNTGATEFYTKIGFARGIDSVWLDKILSKSFSKNNKKIK